MDFKNKKVQFYDLANRLILEREMNDDDLQLDLFSFIASQLPPLRR